MSLSMRERHALDGIGVRIAGSDPQLARLLATFSRLTSGETMPAREEVRLPRPVIGRVMVHVGLGRAMALLWVLVTIGLIALAVALNSSS